MKVYLAGPLFSQAERLWNRALSAALMKKNPGFEILLPQDFKVGEEFNRPGHYGLIFKHCIESIDRCDAVLAILDGCDSDSGTAFELGYAHARKKPILGVRTDFRQNQDRGVNLMLSRACTRLITVPSFHEDTAHLADRVAKTLKTFVKK